MTDPNATERIHEWTSRDGLTLRARCLGAGLGLPVLCLPGLTRNSRDFEALAPRLAQVGAGRAVICPDLRGRGLSDRASEPMSYNPGQYCEDVLALLESLGIGRFIAIGTSLGGLMTMTLAKLAPGRIGGAVLNDIGPEIDPAGLARIRGYVGKALTFADWRQATMAIAAANGPVYPAFTDADWLTFARRILCEQADGTIVFDYDMAIAKPFEAPEGTVPAPDMWPLFDALAGTPLLTVRGGTSDILSATTAAAMAARDPAMALLTVPGVGHAPTLDEPECVAAIVRLVERAA